MFLLSAVTRSTLTACPTSTSYRVTVGPRLNPVTWASMSNCSNTLVSDSTTESLAALRSFGALPGVSTSDGGSMYVTSPASSSCSTRCGSWLVSGASGTRDGTWAGRTTGAGAGGGASPGPLAAPAPAPAPAPASPAA